MTGNDRKHRHPPFIPGKMEIAVTNPAVQDIHGHIVWLGFAAFERPGGQG
jgi:hypothetical protein